MPPVDMLYRDTLEKLQDLDAEELSAVNSVITIIIERKKEQWPSPLGIESEEQLWERIDHSLAQANARQGRDADEVIADLRRKYAI